MQLVEYSVETKRINDVSLMEAMLRKRLIRPKELSSADACDRGAASTFSLLLRSW